MEWIPLAMSGQGRVYPTGTLGPGPGALELHGFEGARSQSLRVNTRLWLMAPLSPERGAEGP